MPSRWRTSELVQPLLILALLSGLIVAVGAIMAPFLAAIIWAMILVSATWGPFRWLSARLGERDRLAALLIVSALLLFILVPLLIASVDFGRQLTLLARAIPEQVQAGLPDLPQWMAGLPLIGDWAAQQWLAIQNQDFQILAPLKGVVGPAARVMLGMAGAIGGGLLMLLLSILIAGVLYAEGEQLHGWVLRFSRRIAGEAGEHLLTLSNRTIRGVVYGFIGAAVAQGGLAWLGLAVAGVPNALSLGLLVCLVSVIPGGPPLVGLLAATWLYRHGEPVWAGLMVVWFLLAVGTIDNVVKSLVIGRNSPLPLTLILFGVIGGAVAFGMLGVFLGPTLLALFHTLVRSWVDGIAVTQICPDDETAHLAPASTPTTSSSDTDVTP